MLWLNQKFWLGKHDNGNDIFFKNGRFGPYLQYEMILDNIDNEIKIKKNIKSQRKYKF